MTARILLVIAALIIGLSNWVAAVEHPGPTPAAVPHPRALQPVVLSGSDAERTRAAMLRRAAVSITPPARARFSAAAEVTSCRYVQNRPSGTTPKFACVLDDGEIVKVKYGRHPEIHAEVAASRLLQMLGYPADHVVMVRRLRCYGCPRYPFAGAYVLSNALTRRLVTWRGDTGGYSDFEWVSVERRFPAPPVETASTKGWHWWELADANADAGGRRRAEVDVLLLLAAFLAHWDNKAENQRIVCLDAPAARDGCGRPLVMIQDLGGTFGPMKVNLSQWRDLPVWHDRATCTVSMRMLPYRGASFGDAVISEAGRAQLAARLSALREADVRHLFSYARFAEYQTGTDDEKDLDAWTAAFAHRASQITRTRCPA